jgi:AcrR family transcriptional regulator
MDGTTVRDIAQEAGVSPGLLRHHFGSKEALREACDAYVLDRGMRIKEQIVFEGKAAEPGYLPSVHPTILLSYKYLTRALLDGSSSAAALFDEMVDITEQWIAKFAPHVSDDPRGFAAVLVGMQAGLLAMHDHVSRALGVDVFTAAGHIRMSGAVADFYSHPLLDADLLARLSQVMQQLRATNPPTAPAQDAGAEGA